MQRSINLYGLFDNDNPNGGELRPTTYHYPITNSFTTLPSSLVTPCLLYTSYVYDYHDRTLNKLTDSDILSYRNAARLKKVDKAFYFDLDQLTFPLYEVSDNIYSYDQTIATSANQNGLRTSFLQRSDNYIFTFEDDGIVVLDTTRTDGYRKKQLINHTINLGCFKYGLSLIHIRCV